MDRSLIQWFGLYFADGRMKKSLSFTNTNPNLIKLHTIALRKFGVDLNKVKARVQISSTYKNKWKAKTLICWWSNLTKIPEKNFWKTSWVETKKTYQRKRQSPSNIGGLDVVYYNVKLFRSVKTNIEKLLATKNPALAKEFLKGIFAGDGFVKLTPKGKLQEVRIGSAYDKTALAKLLQLIGIKPGKFQKLDIPIYGKENFSKIKKLELLKLCPVKLNKFLEGYVTLCGRV